MPRHPEIMKHLAHANRIPGTYGRWCYCCLEYKQVAILHRHGDKASEATYSPHCPTCSSLLFSGTLTDNF